MDAPSWDSLSTTPPDAPVDNKDTPNPVVPESTPTTAPVEAVPEWSSLSPTPPKDSETPNWEDLQTKTQKYSTPEQQFKTVLEGAAQGFAGPLATLAETKLFDVDPEEIKARAAANPWEHGAAEAAGLGAGLFTGTGELAGAAKVASYLTKSAELAEEATVAAKVGSAALKGLIESGAIQTTDEASKYLLGEKVANPEEAASSALAVLGSGILGAATGGVFNAVGQGASKGLHELEANKMGTKAKSFLVGIGVGSKTLSPIQEKEINDIIELEEKHNVSSKSAFDQGRKFYQEGLEKTIGSIASTGTSAAAGVGAHALGGGLIGGLGAYKVVEKLLGPTIEKITGKVLSPTAQKYTIPAAIKVLSMADKVGSNGLWHAMDYAEKVAKGSKLINNSVNGLMSGTKIIEQQGVNALASERDRQKLKDFIEEGGVGQQLQNQLNSDAAQEQSPQSYAEGGEVFAPKPQDVAAQETDHLASVYPEQSMILSAARGRISNYLNQIRPTPNQPKLPFDQEPDQTQKENSYKKALDIAIKPLSILDHIHKGTLEPEHMNHFTSMYPELYNHLQNKIVQKMTDQQIKKEKPPSYKIRQGLSQFMNTPLDSVFTPAAIQAAQASFQSGGSQPPAPPVTKSKKNTSKLNKVAEQYQTSSDAAVARQQAKG